MSRPGLSQTLHHIFIMPSASHENFYVYKHVILISNYNYFVELCAASPLLMFVNKDIRNTFQLMLTCLLENLVANC